MERMRARPRALAAGVVGGVVMALALATGCEGGTRGAPEDGSVPSVPGSTPDAASGAASDAASGQATGADEASADDRVPADASAEGGTTVRVWFTRGESPVAVEREVEGDPLPGALRELVMGPTAAERADGITSWFSEATSGVLRATVVAGDRVVVDFRDLPTLIPNASTSAGSAELLASLDSTVFQFSWVERVEYRLEGSCEAFWNWLQRGCDVVER